MAPSHIRRRRRGLTVLELVIILLVIGLIIFFVFRMRGGEEARLPAPTDTALTAEPLAPAPGGELAMRLGLVAPLDSVAAAGDTLAVRVRATGVADAAVANARIRFDVESGNGQVQPQSATTNDVGEAQARWILGTGAGEQRLRAAVAGNDTAQVTITVTARARQAAP